MKLSQVLFEIKLEELEQRYGQMKKRVALSETKSKEAIDLELVRMKQAYQDNEGRLLESAESGCSPAVSGLALAQLNYCRQAEEILKHQMVSCFQRESDHKEKQAEVMALYAEYAIDFATLAMDHALIAALSAESLQMDLEEREDENAGS